MPFSYNSLQRYKTTGTHSMELVYLWVEDYKNIKKEGFNFSPRFECIYDEVKNELIIDEFHKRTFSKLIKDISEELELL